MSNITQKLNMSATSSSTTPKATNGSPTSSSPTTIPNGFGGRRRSSENKGMFPGLTQHKRDNSDPASAARRASFLDQHPEKGMIGKAWGRLVGSSS